MDELCEYWTGQSYSVDNSSFMENVRAGFENQDTRRLKQRAEGLVMAGRLDEAEELHRQIEERLSRLPQGKGIPFSWWQQQKEAIAQNIGNNVELWMATAEGNMAMTSALTLMANLGGVAGGTAPVAASAAGAAAGVGVAPVAATIAAAGAAFGTAMAFKQNLELSEADAFYDMYWGNGERRNATSAKLYSYGVGVATAFLETFVDGVSSRVVGLAAGKNASKVGVNALVDLTARGSVNRWARGLGEWVTGALDEGFLNEFPERVMGDVANALYRHSVGLPSDFDIRETLSGAMEEAVSGMVVGAVYGGVSIPASMRSMKAEAVALRREANVSASRDAFMDATESLRPEGVTQEDYDAARNQIFDASRKQAADLSLEMSARDKAGFSAFTESSGVAYGAIGVGAGKEGKSILVFADTEALESAYDKLRVSATRTDFSEDGSVATLRFGQRLENGSTAFQELVLTTDKGLVEGEMHAPRGASFNDDMADMELMARPNLAGLSLDDALGQQEVRSARLIVRDKWNLRGVRNKAAAQALAAASRVLHVPATELAENIRIVFEDDSNPLSEGHGGWVDGFSSDDTLATIHLTKRAKPATLFHEVGHVVRRYATPQQLSDIAAVYGVTDGVWSTAQEEMFANDFVRYLRTMTAPTRSLARLFGQIKEILSYITGGEYAKEISPEVAKAFDRLFRGEETDAGVLVEKEGAIFGSPSKEAEERAAKNNIKEEEWEGRSVRDFGREFGETIKRDILSEDHAVLDGVRIVSGISRSDMPFYKELGQMKILQKLGMDGVLLPRFATEYLHSLYGVTLERGSLPDGIVLLDNGMFVEMKRAGNKLVRNVNAAMRETPDLIFVSSLNRLSPKEIKRVETVLKSAPKAPRIIILSEPDCRVYANFGQKISGSRNEPGPGLTRGSQTVLAEWEISHPSEIKNIIDSYFVNSSDDQRLIPYEKYREVSKTSFLEIKKGQIANDLHGLTL